jgi:hypothetical protein
VAKRSLEERAIALRVWGAICESCGHSWGCHGPLNYDAVAKDGVCDECQYEEDHQERETDAPLCTMTSPPELVETPPTAEELDDAIPFWTRWRARQRVRVQRIVRRG